MPESPFYRALKDGLVGHEPPEPVKGKKKRKVKQRKRELYQKIREDLQVSGELPITSEGALRPEQVPSSVQGSQPLTHLVVEAIRRGWNVADDKKPELIKELMDIVLNPDIPARSKIAAFNALRTADQSQWERDHPEAAQGKSGTTVNVSVQSNVAAVHMMNELMKAGEVIDDPNRGLEYTSPSDLTSTPSNSRHTRKVESSSTSEGDK